MLCRDLLVCWLDCLSHQMNFGGVVVIMKVYVEQLFNSDNGARANQSPKWLYF